MGACCVGWLRTTCAGAQLRICAGATSTVRSGIAQTGAAWPGSASRLWEIDDDSIALRPRLMNRLNVRFGHVQRVSQLVNPRVEDMQQGLAHRRLAFKPSLMVVAGVCECVCVVWDAPGCRVQTHVAGAQVCGHFLIDSYAM